MLDDHLFPHNAVQSAAASWTLGVVGLTMSQGWMGRLEQQEQQRHSCRHRHRFPPPRTAPARRLGAVYCLATSCVLLWRGTWVGWDCLYEYYSSSYCADGTSSAPVATDPGHATRSGIVSHMVAVGGLVAAGCLTSVLAPPAAVSILRDATLRGGTTTATTAKMTMKTTAPSTRIVGSSSVPTRRRPSPLPSGAMMRMDPAATQPPPPPAASTLLSVRNNNNRSFRPLSSSVSSTTSGRRTSFTSAAATAAAAGRPYNNNNRSYPMYYTTNFPGS